MDNRAAADMAAIKQREAAVLDAIRRKEVEVDTGPFGMDQLGLSLVVTDARGGLWALRGAKLVLLGAVE